MYEEHTFERHIYPEVTPVCPQEITILLHNEGT